tara:strand:- start:7 stop:783 length:777 start_codon:yes stop_codon:yes gene_type:complete
MWPGFENENGQLIVSSFGIMMFLAFLSCNLFMRKTLKEKNISPDIGDSIVFWAAIGGILGAKLYYIMEFGIPALPMNAGIWDYIQNFGTGLVFYGGLIGGFIAVTLYIYIKKLSWLEYADIVAPLLALGHGIGRIGCLLVPDCMGVESKYHFFPLGVAFPHDPEVYRYPTQFYEMFLYFVIFAYLYSYRHQVKFKGELFFEYLFLTGISRFLIEFLREHPTDIHGHSFYLLGLHGAQIVSVCMIIVGIIFHYKLRRIK